MAAPAYSACRALNTKDALKSEAASTFFTNEINAADHAVPLVDLAHSPLLRSPCTGHSVFCQQVADLSSHIISTIGMWRKNVPLRQLERIRELFGELSTDTGIVEWLVVRCRPGTRPVVHALRRYGRVAG